MRKTTLLPALFFLAGAAALVPLASFIQRSEAQRILRESSITRDQVALLRDRVATAQEVTTAYGEQFRLGQRTLIELLDSGNELFLARTDLTSREYEQILAAYEFLAVKGTLLQDLGVRVDMEAASAPKK